MGNWRMGLGAWVLMMAMAACSGQTDRLIIASWNVQNLFDDRPQGGEYPEFDPNGGTWTSRHYHSRLSRLARGILSLAPGGPDVIALVEVENGLVLDDLADNYLTRGEYRYRTFASQEGANTGLGILSRLPLHDTLAHGFHLGTTGFRPILVTGLVWQGRDLALLINHWKSRREGEAATALARRLQADTLVRIASDYQMAHPETVLMALGDFNEEVTPGINPLAALVEGASPAYNGKGNLSWTFLRAVEVGAGQGNVSEEGSELSTMRWREPLVSGDAGGSYWFRGAWSRLDHALVSTAPGTSGSALQLQAWAASPPNGIDSRGHPLRYDPRMGKGISDHLPLVLELSLP